MEADGLEPPVEFEAVTAVALCWFARKGCDFAVLETGLGGRYDATNVVPGTLVAAITCIGLDHTAILGSTVEKIAMEKSGILKPGCIAVSYPAQPARAQRVVEAAAQRLGCELVTPDPEDVHRRRGLPFENRMEYGGYEVVLPFPGRHQAMNASMAIEIALALWRKGYEITDEQIIAGLEQASFPARIEVLRRQPLPQPGWGRGPGRHPEGSPLPRAGGRDGYAEGQGCTPGAAHAGPLLRAHLHRNAGLPPRHGSLGAG